MTDAYIFPLESSIEISREIFVKSHFYLFVDDTRFILSKLKKIRAEIPLGNYIPRDKRPRPVSNSSSFRNLILASG